MAEGERLIAVYMMANRKHGTLDVGVTGDLISRVVQNPALSVPPPFGHRRALSRRPRHTAPRGEAVRPEPRRRRLRSPPYWTTVFLGPRD
jgi:hypothetical protein